jgi:hypothetical protein
MVSGIFAGVEDHEFDYTNRDTGANETALRWKWTFTVTESGDFQGWTLSGLTSRVFNNNENCKAMNWVVAISGIEYEPDDEVETDVFIGRPVRLLVGQNAGKDGRIWNQIEDVLPAKSSAQDVFG